MKKFAILLSFLCLPLFSKPTDREFVKQQIHKKFGTNWTKIKIHRVTDGSDAYYDVITSDTNLYCFKYISVKRYKTGKSIIAVLEKNENWASYSDGTSLVIFEWYISNSGKINQSYFQKLESIGSLGECICKFDYDKITDTSSVLIIKYKWYFCETEGENYKVIYKDSKILDLTKHSQSTINFEPDEGIDGIDTRAIETNISVNYRKSEISVVTTDYTNYITAGTSISYDDYKLIDNKLVKINNIGQ